MSPSFPARQRLAEYDCLEAPEHCGTVLSMLNTDGTMHWDQQSKSWHRVTRRKQHRWNGKETVYE